MRTAGTHGGALWSRWGVMRARTRSGHDLARFTLSAFGTAGRVDVVLRVIRVPSCTCVWCVQGGIPWAVASGETGQVGIKNRL